MSATLVICAAIAWGWNAMASSRTKPSRETPATIVFVCEHGAAKSVLAAAYFNQLAAARGLNAHAIARGVTPQPELSTATVAGLKSDRVFFPDDKPRALTAGEVRGAARVVAFCPLPPSTPRPRRLETFDVPAPTAGYEAARDAIVAHVRALVEELAAHQR